jgi:hypothetical protein
MSTGQDNDKGGAAARERRLAEALRANLRRRKAQARARRQAEDPPDGGAEAPEAGPGEPGGRD